MFEQGRALRYSSIVFLAKCRLYGTARASMRKKYLLSSHCWILLLLLAIRRPSDSSLRFIKQQDEIAKPQRGSTTH
jgi:hypothetical protein